MERDRDDRDDELLRRGFERKDDDPDWSGLAPEDRDRLADMAEACRAIAGAFHGARRDPLPRRIAHYRIERLLGRGSFGTVLLAVDEKLPRHVAIKILNLGPDARSEAARQLRREAETLAGLESPGLCRIYDYAIDVARPFIVMEYLPGPSLASILEPRLVPAVVPEAARDLLRRSSHAGIMAWTRLVEDVARAIQTAHEAGFVHRDLKPGNILLDKRGAPVVTDFGLARVASVEASSAGVGAGTPLYMAPEQLVNPVWKLDRRVDVFALGIILYEGLTGTHPFATGSPHATGQAIRRSEVPLAKHRNPAVPKDLAIVVAKALAKDRDQRYESALELAEDLRRVREHQPIHARPPSLPRLAIRLGKDYPATTAATLTVLLALIVGFVWSTVTLSREIELRRAAESARSIADARRLVASSMASLERDPGSALEDALAAAIKEPGERTRAAIAAALMRFPAEREFPIAGSFATEQAFDPEETRILACTADHRLLSLDLASGAVEACPGDESGAPRFQAAVVAKSWSGTVAIETTGHLVGRRDAEPAWQSILGDPIPFPNRLLASPDGKRLAVGSASGEVLVVTLDAGSGITHIAFDEDCTPHLSFADDGTSLLVSRSPQRLSVLGLDPTGIWSRRATLDAGANDYLLGAALDGAGNCAWAVTAMGGLLRWDARTGEPRGPRIDLRPLVGLRPGQPLRRVAIHVDSGLLALAGDETVRLLSVEADDPVPVGTLRGATRIPRDLTFARSGRRLAVAGGAGDAALRVYRLDLPFRTVPLAGFDEQGVIVAVAETDGSSVVGVVGSRVVVWDLKRHGRLGPYIDGVPGSAYGVAADRGGKRLAIHDSEGSLRFAEISGREATVRVLSERGDPIRLCVFSPDGSRLLAATREGSLRFGDPMAAVPFRDLGTPHESILDASFDPGGRRFAVCTAAGRLVLFEAETGSPVDSATIDPSHQPVEARFGPRGESVLVRTRGGVAYEWVPGGVPRRLEPRLREGVLLADGRRHAGTDVAEEGGLVLSIPGSRSWTILDPRRPTSLLSLDGVPALIVGFDEGTVALYDPDPESGLRLRFGLQVEPGAPIVRLGWDPDRRLVIAVSAEGRVHFVPGDPVEQALRFAAPRDRSG